AGHPGLFLVLDEVEIVLRMRRPERMKSLEVLRQLVDAVDQNEFPGLHLLVTGTPDFFDSTHGVAGLEPLHERLKVDFRPGTPDNLRQAQIRLQPFDRERLMKVAGRVRELYPAKTDLQARVPETFVRHMVEQVTRGFGGQVEVVPRLFLREFVNVLDLVDQRPDYDPQRAWRFEPSVGVELKPEEEVALMASPVREVLI
ncbi:MAG TPA: BREX system ATP-binding domain-containing protein, partial [Candidatus Xenobia bacterium]